MFGFLRGPRPASDQLERIEALERRLKSIEVEWEDWFGKYRRLYARLAKRVEKDERDEATSPPETRSPHERPSDINPLALALLRGNHDAVLHDR